ncbi:nucleotidyltransferase [Clostridium botulinum]
MINKNLRKKDIIKLIERLDISPSMFKAATDKYINVGKFLLDNNISAEIYPQGSFATGTVVRPYRDSKDSNYDVDCICLLNVNKSDVEAKEVKNIIGDILKSNKMYAEKLLPEDSRCWTLEYAENSGIGFNLDLVPSVDADYDTISKIISIGVKDDFANKAISITNKERAIYNWCNSNPKGYAEWFNEINKPFLDYNRKEKRQMLFEANRHIYNSVEEIPCDLERSALQRVVQILKRHRDIYFAKINRTDDKPISAIITTLVGKIGENITPNLEIFDLLQHVVNEIYKYSELLSLNQQDFSILYENSYFVNKDNDRWTILNPVNPLDNLADSWNDKPEKAKIFFKWVKQIKMDFLGSLDLEDDKFINILENSLGSNLVKNNIDIKKYNNMTVAPTVIMNTPKPYRN